MGINYNITCECGFSSSLTNGGARKGKPYYPCFCNTCNSLFSDTFYTQEDNNFLPRDILCKHCGSSDLSRYETSSGSLCPKCDRYSLVFKTTMMSS